MIESTAPEPAEIQAFDPVDIDDLYAALRGVPGITVKVAAARIAPGEQGVAIDYLMVTLAIGAIPTFLQIIRTLAEAGRPRFVVIIRRGRSRVEINADNVDDVEPLVRKLFVE